MVAILLLILRLRLALSWQADAARDGAGWCELGAGSGAVQIAGPPVIIFWLGGRRDAITVRRT